YQRREQKLSRFSGIEGAWREDAERLTCRPERSHQLESHAKVECQAPICFPGVLCKPFHLVVSGMIGLFRVVFAVGVHRSGERIRVWISRIYWAGGIGSEIVRTC